MKKNFKGGLGSLIKETVKNREDDETNDKQEPDTIESLQSRIALLNRELHLWRIGKLTPEKFDDSMAKHGMKYNATLQKLEIIK